VKLRAFGVAWVCLAALGVAAAIVAPAFTTGCQTHQCDGDYIHTIPDGGFVSAGSDIVTLDPASGYSLWESSAFDGPWLDFPGQRTYEFGWGGFNFTSQGPPQLLVATDPSPNAPDASGNYVVAGGQLAEVGELPGHLGFRVFNATCAHYYLYVAVWGNVPPPPPPAPIDAGNDTSADAPGDGDAGAAD
jgi:hypothetical protein